MKKKDLPSAGVLVVFALAEITSFYLTGKGVFTNALIAIWSIL